MKTIAKKKPGALARKNPTEEQREELRKEVADWYYTAKSLVDHLYHPTHSMVSELSKADSPLLEFLDHGEMAQLSSWLDQASTRLADIVVDVGIPSRTRSASFARCGDTAQPHLPGQRCPGIHLTHRRTMSVTTVALNSLFISPLYQSRSHGVCSDTVTDYTTAIEGGAKFPLLVAYRVTDRKHPGPALVAGFHRAEAYAVAGVTECKIELRDGTHAEAWLAGFQSNQTHGLRYSNADKRRAAEHALSLFTSDSNRQLAERMGLSQEFIAKVRREMETNGAIEPVDKIVSKDGTVRPSGRSNQNNGDAATVAASLESKLEELVSAADPADEVEGKHGDAWEPPDEPDPMNTAIPLPMIDLSRTTGYQRGEHRSTRPEPDHPFADILKRSPI